MISQTVDANIENAVSHLFDEHVALTGITEYGVSWEDMLAGKAQIPAQGARFDIAFEGKLNGLEINGVVKGADFLQVRADGKFILNIQASIITDDGESIALKESGLLTPGPDGQASLHLNMSFSTASEQYRWINSKQVWGIGEVDMFAGQVSVKGYINK